MVEMVAIGGHRVASDFHSHLSFQCRFLLGAESIHALELRSMRLCPVKPRKAQSATLIESPASRVERMRLAAAQKLVKLLNTAPGSGRGALGLLLFFVGQLDLVVDVLRRER